MASRPWAKTVLSSRHADAPKTLTTLLARMPRIILAEFNTHRQLTRNAASTRAIPTKKLIEQVMVDPFIPLVWGMNTKGMQSMGVHEDALECERNWLLGRDRAVRTAEDLAAMGLHKQIVGRVLEPWMWTLVCTSATEWSNFLHLRDHSAAEPHMGILAGEIRIELQKEPMQILQPGEWHLPFVNRDEYKLHPLIDLQKKSVACCASTSYKTVDGFEMTWEKIEDIYGKLLSSDVIHASPFEHQAAADKMLSRAGGDMGNPKYFWASQHRHGNFQGFEQYRKMLPGECR